MTRSELLTPSVSECPSLLGLEFPSRESLGGFVTVVPWTSSHILYGLPLHQKGDVSKATC